MPKINLKLASNFGKFNFTQMLDKIISYQKNQNILVSGGRKLKEKTNAKT